MQTQTRWDNPNRNSLFTEYNVFADMVKAKFPNAKICTRAYSGGVPGMEADLTMDQYEAAKEWLTEQLGQPEVVESWHPNHTKGIPPLKFKVTPELQHMRMSHVNLIAMMQRKDKRFTMLTWM